MTLAPVTVTGRGRGAGRGRGSGSNQQPSADGSHSGSSHASQPSRPAASLFSAVGGTKSLENEYDPARPNDYEAIRAERERLRIEARSDRLQNHALQAMADEETTAMTPP